jgi:hypothetical protein
MVQWIPAHVGSGSSVLIGRMASKEKVDMTDDTIEWDPVSAYVHRGANGRTGRDGIHPAHAARKHFSVCTCLLEDGKLAYLCF